MDVKKPKKKKLCQLCEKREATVGWNCKPCNDGIKQRDQERIDTQCGPEENYCGGY